jgi:inhibitor of KinA sporulation pathway (predicted exonuclease)
MIDIETLGKGRNALIVSIGAVEFDLKQGILGRELLLNIDIGNAHRNGGIIDADTIMWWMKQSDEARAALATRPRMPLYEALDRLNYWMSDAEWKRDVCVWGNGSTFDISILEDSMKLVHLNEYWSFRKVRDMRTFVDMFDRLGYFVPKHKRGVAHTALDDARNQAQTLINLWEKVTDAVHTS